MPKQFVTIHSNVTINVTSGLQHQDVTNPDAHVADRLKINPTWPKYTCLIRQGQGVYPSEITSWQTVKALVKDGVMTIGDYTDTANEETQTMAKKIRQVKQTAKTSLADIAAE